MSVPPSELTPDTFAARLYAALAPLAYAEESTSWALLVYCNALGVMYQLIEDLVRDTSDGPGWSLLLDLDRCPDWALPWLGQFAGVRVISGSTPDQMRARIASTDGFKRGTVAALMGAAQATLTGAKAVVFRERDHDPADTPNYAYYLSVRTYADQTPNPSATLAALMTQKPAGIVLNYAAASGQDWQQVKNDYATWGDVKSHYTDWLAVAVDEPS
jgi:hypothetical protein